MSSKSTKFSDNILKHRNKWLITGIAAAGFSEVLGGQPQPEYGIQVPQPLYGVVAPIEMNPEPNDEAGATINIFGSALNGKTNAPIPGAQIQLFADGSPVFLTVTDENGSFHILYRGLLDKDKEYRVKATPLDGTTKEKLAPADTIIKSSGVRMESIKDSLIFKLSPAKVKKRK